jgi:hypothetical protein
MTITDAAAGVTMTLADPVAAVVRVSLTETDRGPTDLSKTPVKVCWPLSAAVNV